MSVQEPKYEPTFTQIGNTNCNGCRRSVPHVKVKWPEPGVSTMVAFCPVCDQIGFKP